MADVRRKPTVAVLRCASRGHLLLSVHHLAGVQFEVVRPAVSRAGGIAGDQDAFLRHGAGTEPAYEALDESRRIVEGTETHTVTGLLGPESPWLFCRCGSALLSVAAADELGEAIGDWYESGQNTTRPTAISLAIGKPRVGSPPQPDIS